jgi:chromosome segregation ATPase
MYNKKMTETFEIIPFLNKVAALEQQVNVAQQKNVEYATQVYTIQNLNRNFVEVFQSLKQVHGYLMSINKPESVQTKLIQIKKMLDSGFYDYVSTYETLMNLLSDTSQLTLDKKMKDLLQEVVLVKRTNFALHTKLEDTERKLQEQTTLCEQDKANLNSTEAQTRQALQETTLKCEQQLANLNSTIESIQQQLSNNQSEIVSRQNAIGDLQQQLNLCQSQSATNSATFQTQLANAQLEVQDKKDLLAEAKAALQVEKQERIAATSKILELGNEISVLNNAKAEIETQLASSQSTGSAYQTQYMQQLEMVNEDLVTAQKELRLEKQVHENAQTKIAQLELNITNLTLEKETAVNDLAACRQNAIMLQTNLENDRLTLQETLTNQNNQLQLASNQRVSDLEAAKALLDAEITALRQNMGEKTDLLQRAEAEKVEADQRAFALQAEVNRLIADKEAIQQQLTTFTMSSGADQTTIENLTNQLSDLSRAVNTMTLSKNAAVENASQLAATVASLTLEKETLERKLQEEIATTNFYYAQVLTHSGNMNVKDQMLGSAQTRVNDLSATIANLQLEKADLETLLETTQSSCSTDQSFLSSVRQQLENKEREIEILNSQKNETTLLVNELNAEVSTLRADIVKLNQAVADKDDLIHAADNAKTNAEREKVAAETDKTTADQRIVELTAELSLLTTGKQRVEREMANLSTSFTTERALLQTQIDNLTTDIVRLTSEKQEMVIFANQLNSRIQELTAQVMEKDREIATLRTETIAVRNLAVTLRSSIDTQTQQLQESQARQNALSSLTSNLQSSIETKTRELQQSKQHELELQQLLDNLNQEKTNVERELYNCNSEKSVLALGKSEAERKFNECKVENTELNADNLNLITTYNQDLAYGIRDRTAQIETELKEENAESIRNTKSWYEEKIENLKEEKSALQNDNEQLRAQITRNNTNYTTVVQQGLQENQALQREIQQLQNTLVETEARCEFTITETTNEIQTQLTQAQQEIQTLQDKNTQLTTDGENLANQCNTVIQTLTNEKTLLQENYSQAYLTLQTQLNLSQTELTQTNERLQSKDGEIQDLKESLDLQQSFDYQQQLPLVKELIETQKSLQNDLAQKISKLNEIQMFCVSRLRYLYFVLNLNKLQTNVLAQEKLDVQGLQNNVARTAFLQNQIQTLHSSALFLLQVSNWLFPLFTITLQNSHCTFTAAMDSLQSYIDNPELLVSGEGTRMYLRKSALNEDLDHNIQVLFNTFTNEQVNKLELFWTVFDEQPKKLSVIRDKDILDKVIIRLQSTNPLIDYVIDKSNLKLYEMFLVTNRQVETVLENLDAKVLVSNQNFMKYIEEDNLDTNDKITTVYSIIQSTVPLWESVLQQFVFMRELGNILKNRRYTKIFLNQAVLNEINNVVESLQEQRQNIHYLNSRYSSTLNDIIKEAREYNSHWSSIQDIHITAPVSSFVDYTFDLNCEERIEYLLWLMDNVFIKFIEYTQEEDSNNVYRL